MVPAPQAAHVGPLIGTAPAPLACTVVSDPAEAERLRPEWDALLARSARPEITHSSDWLLTWWDVYGRLQGRQLRLGLFRDGDRLVGVTPLSRRRHCYWGGIPFRRLEFLASGEPAGDGIYSNHLTILAERGAEERVVRRFVDSFAGGAFGSWDEVVLPMMDGDGPVPGLLVEACRAAGLSADLRETARAPYLPLPATWDDYLRTLSANGRRNINRALKAFDAWAGGTTRLECATDSASLEKGREALVRLHHARWTRDAETGVFRSSHYLRFHDTVMRKLLERGQLELIWLTVRGEPVAALYGMAWGGKVYAYQTGRLTDLPSAIRPGVVVLAHAIRRAITSGRHEFDLLADEAPYKMQLTETARRLVEVRIVRPCLVEAIRKAAKWCLHAARRFAFRDK